MPKVFTDKAEALKLYNKIDIQRYQLQSDVSFDSSRILLIQDKA